MRRQGDLGQTLFNVRRAYVAERSTTARSTSRLSWATTGRCAGSVGSYWTVAGGYARGIFLVQFGVVVDAFGTVTCPHLSATPTPPALRRVASADNYHVLSSVEDGEGSRTFYYLRGTAHGPGPFWLKPLRARGSCAGLGVFLSAFSFPFPSLPLAAIGDLRQPPWTLSGDPIR